MRSQSAIFIDAGYLIAGAATSLTGSSLRRGVSVDYEQLVTALIALVEDKSGLPLLRVYWYDAGKNGVAGVDHERVAMLPRVKLRLGRLGVEGEQKGVDLRIGLDMVGHARNGAVDTIYLLSGDDDLTEAVEEAQAHGVQIVVLAVPTASGAAHGVSRNLLKAADGVEILAGSVLDASVKAAVTAPPTQTVGGPSPAQIAALSGASAPTPSPGSSGAAPAPKLPAPSTSSYPASPAFVPPAVVYSAGGGAKPYVAAEYQRDPVELTTAIKEVVRKSYDAWSKTATQAQREDLRAGRPTIPRDLDRALLVDLSDALKDDYLSEKARAELRSRFWDVVETLG